MGGGGLAMERSRGLKRYNGFTRAAGTELFRSEWLRCMVLGQRCMGL